MKTITFLRSFTTTRVVKGKFCLAGPNGNLSQGFAFGQWTNHFQRGQLAAVDIIKGNVLVVTDCPAVGEVVLDGATEGVDFEVVCEMGATTTDAGPTSARAGLGQTHVRNMELPEWLE